jgi:molybdate transport system ATP-binding protein
VSAVFTRPADVTAARIVGMETVHPGRVMRFVDGLATVVVGTTAVTAVVPDEPPAEVFVCIRAEDVILLGGGVGPTSARNRLRATVTAVTPEGPLVRVTLDAGFSLTALITRPAYDELGLAPGQPVVALIKAQAVHLIPHGGTK